VNVYVDSSVVLRIVLGERHQLPAWRRIRRPLSSQLIRVECLRTIDRARVRLSLDEPVLARRRAAVLEVLEGFDTMPVDAAVLARAAEPFPTTVGTLDAIHLASALRLRAQIPDLRLATHDAELATAALAVGFDVLGAPVER
jgi:predicted nucleic acid-binding protein